MKTYAQFIGEAKIDTRTSADFADELSITSAIKKDKRIKAHGGGKPPVYFDDGVLVWDDLTVLSNILDNDGWDNEITIEQMIQAILRMPKFIPYSKAKNTSHIARAPGRQMVGKFNVLIPTQLSGITGGKPSDLKNPRLIITADDLQASEIKKFHNSALGVKVRIMKRKGESKIYVDFLKAPEEFERFLTKLEKL